jgi:hypothetical protein
MEPGARSKRRHDRQHAAYYHTHIYTSDQLNMYVCVHTIKSSARTSPQTRDDTCIPGGVATAEGQPRRAFGPKFQHDLGRAEVSSGRGVEDFTSIRMRCTCVHGRACVVFVCVCGRKVLSLQAKSLSCSSPRLGPDPQILLAWLPRSSCIVGVLVACRCGTDSDKLSCARRVSQHVRSVLMLSG